MQGNIRNTGKVRYMSEKHEIVDTLNEMLNNITLGDSYKIIKQIPDKSIDLIYTDIHIYLQMEDFQQVHYHKE